MTDIIQLLPDHVANQIAAGENVDAISGETILGSLAQNNTSMYKHTSQLTFVKNASFNG